MLFFAAVGMAMASATSGCASTLCLDAVSTSSDEQRTYWNTLGVDGVRRLLDAGTHVNERCESVPPAFDLFRMPLHFAVENENAAVVQALLDAGAEVNAKDEDGVTPLHKAAYENVNAEVLQLLLEAGANANERSENDSAYAHLNPNSIRLPYTEVEVNAKAVKDWMLQHLVARWGENTVRAELLRSGVFVDLEYKSGETPLHFAAKWGENTEMVQMLLDAGADVNAKDGNSETPLHEAAYRNANTAVLQLLLDAGTPLHMAAFHENPAMAQMLIEAGVDVNAMNVTGWTALDYASGPISAYCFLAELGPGEFYMPGLGIKPDMDICEKIQV